MLFVDQIQWEFSSLYLVYRYSLLTLYKGMRLSDAGDGFERVYVVPDEVSV
ncbi:hypothetical protein Droror1_Dr00026875, partial [Drosera rotundifolia]